METVEVKSHEGGIYWRDNKGRVLSQIGNLPVHEGMSVATDGKYIYGSEHFGASPYILPDKTDSGGIPIYYENTQKGYFNTQTLKYERSNNREPQTAGWKRKCLVNTEESEWAFPICEESADHEFTYEFDADMLIGNAKDEKKYYTYQIVGDGVAYSWNTKLKSKLYAYVVQNTTTTFYEFESEANPEKSYSETTTTTLKSYIDYREYAFDGNGTLKEAGGERVDANRYYGRWYGFPRLVIRDKRTDSIVRETKIKFYKLAEMMLEKLRRQRKDLFVWDDMRLIDSTIFMRNIFEKNTKTGRKEYPIYRLDGKTRRVGMFLTIVLNIGGVMRCTRHFPAILADVRIKDRHYDAKPSPVPGVIWNWQWEKTTNTTKRVSYVSAQSNCSGNLEFWTRMYLETSFDEDSGEIDLSGAYTEPIWEFVKVTGDAAMDIYSGVKSSEITYKNYEYWHGHRVQAGRDVVDYSTETYAKMELEKGDAIEIEQGLKDYKSEKDVIYLLQDGYYGSYGGYVYNSKKQLLMRFERTDEFAPEMRWVLAFCDAGKGVYLILSDSTVMAFKKAENGYQFIPGGETSQTKCMNKKLRKFKAIKQYIGGG